MVISVFPDVSQGFARYEQSRRARLQDQALRTQNNMMQRRQAAFQDMVAGLEGREAQMAEAMGLNYVPFAAQRDAARQAAEQEAAAAAQKRLLRELRPTSSALCCALSKCRNRRAAPAGFQRSGGANVLFARREGYQDSTQKS